MAAFIINSQYQDLKQQFHFSSTNFDDLVCILKAIYNLPSNSTVVVKYTDDEGDAITVSTSTEWAEALTLNPEGLSLQLFVEPNQTEDVPQSIQYPNEKTPFSAVSDNASLTPYSYNPNSSSSNSSTTTQAHAFTDFDVFRNEFHYHRLIVQTAIEDFFRSLGANLNRPSSPNVVAEVTNTTTTTEESSAPSSSSNTLRDVIYDTLSQWRHRIEQLPSPREIAAIVAIKLGELHSFAAPIVEDIRTRIFSTLEFIYAAMNTRQITFHDITEATEIGAQVAMQDIASKQTENENETPSPLETSDSTSSTSSTSQRVVVEELTQTFDVVNMSEIRPVEQEAKIASTSIETLSNDQAEPAVQEPVVFDTSSVAAAAAPAAAATQVPAVSVPVEATATPIESATATTPVESTSVFTSPVLLGMPTPTSSSEHVQVSSVASSESGGDDDFVIVDDNGEEESATHESRLLDSLIMPPMIVSSVEPVQVSHNANRRWSSEVQQLQDMGFDSDVNLMKSLLDAASGSVSTVVSQLMN